MPDLNAFMRLTKADDAQRLVWGVLAAEVPDHSNEILDYDTAVPAFKAWSDKRSAATAGKSLGNIRGQHGNIAAGVLKELVFDDATKSIVGCAHIVDDNEWEKVQKGVYSGFSLGGKYANRWPDRANPALKRYTPEVIEVSIVDVPCIPSATFDYIKADGAVEKRKFQATIEAEGEIAQGWKAKDGSFHLKKADAITHNVNLKVSEALAPLTKALQDADDALKAKEPAVEAAVPEPAERAAEPATVSAAEPEPADTVTKTVEADPVAANAPAVDAAEVGKAKAAALAKALTSVKETLAKGIFDIARLVCVIDDLCWLQDSIQWEAIYEGDNSPLPADLKSILGTLCDFLKKLVEEETAELTTDKAAGLSQDQVDALRKATGKPDLLKDFKPAAPAGDDLAKLQTSLTDALEKLDAATAEKDAIMKSMAGVTETVTALNKRIEHLEAQPMPVRAIKTTTVSRDHERQESGSDEISVEVQTQVAQKYRHLPPDQARPLVLKDLQDLRAKK